MAAFMVAAVGTPEATGSANETVQLPHWGDVPLSVTLTLAIVAPARVGVGFGEATALGPAVSAGVAAPSAGVGTADGVMYTIGGVGAADRVT
jgi:hypothetical protein